MKSGEFKLALGENDLTLRCTPYALRNILEKHGGIRSVLQKLYNVEFQIQYDIIRSGLFGDPREKSIDKDALESEIFSAGIINLVEPLSTFVTLLSNGGREMVDEKDEKEGKA